MDQQSVPIPHSSIWPYPIILRDNATLFMWAYFDISKYDSHPSLLVWSIKRKYFSDYQVQILYTRLFIPKLGNPTLKQSVRLKRKDEQNLMMWLNSAAFINLFSLNVRCQNRWRLKTRQTATWNWLWSFKRHNWKNETFVSHISIYRNMPRWKNFWFSEICWDTSIWMDAE